MRIVVWIFTKKSFPEGREGNDPKCEKAWNLTPEFQGKFFPYFLILILWLLGFFFLLLFLNKAGLPVKEERINSCIIRACISVVLVMVDMCRLHCPPRYTYIYTYVYIYVWEEEGVELGPERNMTIAQSKMALQNLVLLTLCWIA